MKYRFLTLIAPLLVLALFVSCTPKVDDAVCVIEMSAVSQDVLTTYTSATFELDITTNFNGAIYTVVAGDNVTYVDPKGDCVIALAGKHRQIVNVRFDANSTTSVREIKVSIVCQGKTLTHTIRQAGLGVGAISFTPAAPENLVASTGQSFNITVTSNSAWIVKDGDHFNASASLMSASAGEKLVKITVFKNNSTTATRPAYVKFTTTSASFVESSVTWSVTQNFYVSVADKFATGNLMAAAGAVSGYAIGAPEDYGSFFKWGSLYTYDATNAGEGWGDNTTGAATNPQGSGTGRLGYDYVGLSGGTAHPGDPCQGLGTNYKTPTLAQWRALTDEGSKWGTYKDKGGCFFGINVGNCNNATIAENCIFLPASGYRGYLNGTRFYVGNTGYYWSSSVYSGINSYVWEFGSGSSGVIPDGYWYRGYGSSVRCIKEGA